MPVWIDGGPRRHRMRRTLAIAMLPALAVGGAATLYAATQTASDTSLTVGSNVSFTGQGNGHGRGMGQWGAFGYAKSGWKAEQIVAHYYGGSTLARADVNLPVKVQLTKQNAVNVYAPAGAKVGDQQVAPGQAVRIGNGNATITTGCGGPVVKTVAAGDNTVSPVNAGANRPENEILRFCGSNATYRGALTAKDGKVYNVVNVEDYLRSVVPVESQVSWADQGGMEALRAQAIAARSYALAEGAVRGDRYNDTQDSQVYGGFAKEDKRTDQAVSTTAGLVMAKNGHAVPTEFSSSTGGYTSGGDFTAVKDDGDVVSPFRNWTVSVPASKIGSAFGVGTLKSIRVTEVQSASVPRPTKVEVAGSARTVTVSGMDVRNKLGLRSDWFVIDGQGPAQPGAAGAPGGSAAPASPAPGAVVDRQIVAAPVDPFNPVPTAPNAAQAAPAGASTATASSSAADAAPATSAAPATAGVAGVAAVPTVPGAPAAAAPAAPAAPAVSTIPGVPAPPAAGSAPAAVPVAPAAPAAPAVAADPAAAAAAAKTAIDTTYQAAGGEGGALGKVASNPVTFPDGSTFQAYQNGVVYYTPTTGARVVQNGQEASATLMNWVLTFASGGAPQLPPLPLLNLVPGWGDLLGINPVSTSAAPGVPAVPVSPSADATAPSGAATTSAAAPAAPADSGAPATPAAPSTPADPAAPAAPSAAAAPTPLAVPTVPGAPA